MLIFQNMGNDQSQLAGIEIEEKAVEVSDFWSQHSANILDSDNITNLSVFIGELFVDGSLWNSQTPLEKSTKNLMIYRHPCIIKYVSSWQKSSKFYLAVEEVIPLSHILPVLNTLQICIGLHSTLKALHFLHEKAFVAHNNICIASIYVTKDGSWKLGGMEYLCKYKDLSLDYLSKCKTNRYGKAVDPNEDKLLQNNLGRKDFIDIYGFGILAYEILKLKSDDDIPTLSIFREYCKNELQNPNLTHRPKFNAIIDHEFFNHDFITIHSFLVELPLKSDEDKQQFFQSLGERLKNFNEMVVASQLSGLLLSRMVLLNKSAQKNVLPLILSPRVDKEASNALFSEETFKKFISPKLLEIMAVRDAQIRLLLLNYFPNFMQIFSKEELQTCILPELLVGIKDTNDHIVSATLSALADLVPILGAATVVGGKRAKLFNDGRPISHTSKKSSKMLKPRGSIQSIATATLQDVPNLNTVGVSSHYITELPERPRPDGEENDTSTDEIEQSLDDDLDNWEDWDISEINGSLNSYPTNSKVTENTNQLSSNALVDANLKENIMPSNAQEINMQTKTIPDISELDIKNQLNGNHYDDIDFFQDMEPVINTTNKFLIDESKPAFVSNNEKEMSSKLAVKTSEIGDEGWGDEDWE